MQAELLPINQGEYLNKALKNKGYNNIPSNVILKKILPGLGATYGEINAKRHSIIIEPNVPVILGKTKDKPQLLGIYGGVTESKIEKYLKDNSIKYKKLITTPESYRLIKKVILNRNVKLDLYQDFFCLFDECEKLIQDIDYRESITQPINDFFKFTNKAFVSATVLDMTHPEFDKQNFRILEVKPTWDYKKDIELIITNTFEYDLLEKIRQLEKSECVCVFLNKTDSINKIVNSLRIKEQTKIFCSDKSVKKLKTKGYKNVIDKIELPLAKYNFFTCRFFSAVDIETKQIPDILILTALRDAHYTMIDPFSESIQIYGRFRKTKYHGDKIPFNSITHLTDFNPHFEIKTKDQIELTIATYKATYEEHKAKIKNSDDDTIREALSKDLNSLAYTDFLDDNGEFNYFSQDNFYHAERVKEYYSNPRLLEQAYRDTNHFNVVKLTINDGAFTYGTNWFKGAGRKPQEIRKEIIESLRELQNQQESNLLFDIEQHKEVLRRVEVSATETGDLMVDAFDYIGISQIEKIGYSQLAKLKNEIDKAKAKQKQIERFSVIQEEIKQVYKIGDQPTKEETKILITDLYNMNGIDTRVTQTTIDLYCKTTSNNGKKPPIYTIKGFKSTFGE